ncbi:MAG: discoidin domain-containing protein [Nostoc sp.]|uniref:discoidin domain-containing protein n=1 Tax=Nostoc sp. TaxID=1180 RepID=UPI002FF5093C
MEISKLKTLAIPTVHDVLPILDIDGGLSGKPILRKATLSSLLALVDNDSSDNGFTVPTLIKTVAESGDYFIGIGGDGIPYKITKTDLLAGLSNGGDDSNSGDNSGSSSTNTTLNFVSSGDNKGLFYYLGTNKLTSPWNNPSIDSLNITASAVENGTVSLLVDRQDSEFWTPSVVNNWVSFHLTTGKLICNYYSIKTRKANVDYYPRNWKLQGSNDGSTWNDLDNQINNTNLTAISQWLSLPVTTSVSYSYFRLLTTGANSSGYYHLCLGEVELYGSYVL